MEEDVSDLEVDVLEPELDESPELLESPLVSPLVDPPLEPPLVDPPLVDPPLVDPLLDPLLELLEPSSVFLA